MEGKMTKCPKCDSGNVFTRKGQGVGFNGAIWVGMGSGMQTTSDWISYLCTDCGYFENYMIHHEWLVKIQTEPEKHGWRKAE